MLSSQNDYDIKVMKIFEQSIEDFISVVKICTLVKLMSYG